MSFNNDHTYQSGNYNRHVNNPRFISQLFQQVSTKLKRIITESEQMFIVNEVKNISPKLLKGHSPKKILNALSDVMFKQILNGGGCEDNLDNVREMMRQEIGTPNVVQTQSVSSYNMQKQQNINSNIKSIFGSTSPYFIQKTFNPKALISRNYIYLDSRYRLLDTPGTSSISFNHTNGTTTRQQGSVNTIGNIQNIIGMRIYPIRIPYVQSADNEYKRLTMLVKEFIAQSFIAQENRHFHFEMSTSVDGRFINLDPENHNDGYFWFRKPITSIDAFTITFGNPLQPVIFDNDRELCTFTIGSNTTVTTNTAHNLSNGDRVYFEDFTSDDIAADSAVINAINSADGHIILNTTSNSFEIAVDSSGITPKAGLSVVVYYGARRIFIAIELIYIRSNE